MIATLSLISYTLGLFAYIRRWGKFQWMMATALGFITQAWFLYKTIDHAIGQNIAFVNTTGCVIWVIVGILLISSGSKGIINLSLVVLPAAILSTLSILLFPGNLWVHTEQNTLALIHILSAILTMSLLGLGGIQALLVFTYDQILRKRISLSVANLFPSLQAMEQLLFQLLTAGFICLTSVLITSIWSFYSLTSWVFLPKLCLSLVIWMVFAVILVGHYGYGWRGKLALRWILGGIFLLLVVYFISLYRVEYRN